MKIIVNIFLQLLIFGILLCSCGNPQPNLEGTVIENASAMESHNSVIEDDSLKVEIEDSSIFFAKHMFPDGLYNNGIQATLYYKLIKGYRLDTPPFDGKAWSGTFQYSLELKDEKKTIIKSYETQDICFYLYTQINFADYNGDGLLDFTLCEQESAQPNCKIMTIRPDGIVDCIGEIEFYCACPAADGSPLFELNPDGNGFYIDYHHPTGEMRWVLKDEIDTFFEICEEYKIYGAYLAYVREEYQWQDNQFVLIEHKLMPFDETDEVFMEVFSIYLEKINQNSER